MSKRDSRKWTLIDGVRRNADHPTTFEIPDEAERLSVPIGAFVKVGFEWPEKVRQGTFGAERMWVKITDVIIDDERTVVEYSGVLDNDPVVFDEVIKCGDLVDLEPKHILSIMAAE